MTRNDVVARQNKIVDHKKMQTSMTFLFFQDALQDCRFGSAFNHLSQVLFIRHVWLCRIILCLCHAQCLKLISAHNIDLGFGYRVFHIDLRVRCCNDIFFVQLLGISPIVGSRSYITILFCRHHVPCLGMDASIPFLETLRSKLCVLRCSRCFNTIV